MEFGSIEVDTSRNGVLVIALLGDHDMANAHEFSHALTENSELDSGIVVDLSRATFIDSAILNVLVSANKNAARARQRLAIVCPQSSNIHHVLEVSGLDKVLACHSDLDSALSTLGRED